LQIPALRVPSALALATCALALTAGCGGDDEPAQSEKGRKPSADLGAIKTYLLDHTTRLEEETGKLRAGAEDYYAMAKAVDFDYDRLLRESRAEVASFVKDAQADYRAANPAYEEMEGVVAGVPELADFDVIIDAGSDKSDPENAVPFSINTPGGKTFEQPGNFMFLAETSAYGTEPRFAAKGVRADLDHDGKVEFGETVPDADFYVAAMRDFERNAKELDAAARQYQPTDADALTALVVMTPTMSEYFGAWKNSRFVSGEKATEKAFVGASRLQDISDILGGLVLIYENMEPRIAEADSAQARQTGESLKKLRAFADRLRAREAAGTRFTAEQADTLGAEAQGRAEDIAGQVSQVAAKLDIELEEG